jgi:hypothetical protein
MIRSNRWAVCFALWASPLAMAQAEQITFDVTEPAGIRRFGYPVEATLTFPAAVPKATGFRLLHEGKPIGAQFTLSDNRRRVEVDYSVSLGPHERHRFVLEYGPEIITLPLGNGMRLEKSESAYHVHGGGGYEYVVPNNLHGLLKFVRGAKSDYLRADSVGLVVEGEGGKLIEPAGFFPPKVLKSGPHTFQLRFDGRFDLPKKNKAASAIVLTFPITKSWVRVDWTLAASSNDGVANLIADLNLNIQGEPALIDFGAKSQVYTPLKKGESAQLLAYFGGKRDRPTPLWIVATGREPRSQYAVGAGLAEGWAHVMDRERCTAAAISGFRNGAITVDADGRLRLAVAAGSATTQQFTFWLHFVPMPYHVGAATSPQSMQSPLKVEQR